MKPNVMALPQSMPPARNTFHSTEAALTQGRGRIASCVASRSPAPKRIAGCSVKALRCCNWASWNAHTPRGAARHLDMASSGDVEPYPCAMLHVGDVLFFELILGVFAKTKEDPQAADVASATACAHESPNFALCFVQPAPILPKREENLLLPSNVQFEGTR